MARQSAKESTSRLFNRYVWLVDIIYRHNNHITFEEINSRWINSDLNTTREGFPLKTFHNHKLAISEMFDIDIECDKRNGYTYYIDNVDNIKQGNARSWLLSSIAINNLINETHQLKSRILFEKTPSGQDYLIHVIKAMRDGVSLEMTYQNYRNDLPHTIEVQPYCVKIFKQRWYVIGNNSKNQIRIYSLDRIQSLKTTDNKFTMPNGFDGEAYFVNCYGITNSGEPEFVEIKVLNSDKKNRYLKDLPLHHSQEIIMETDEYTQFRYYIQPTYDFRQELLSHGDQIEVLSPEWLRNDIIEIIDHQNNMYNIH